MLSDFEAAPFGDGPSLPAVLANAADGGASQALVATAWLRRAGLAAVHAPLTAIAGCGGPVRLLVGCEFGGTTRDAVTDAVQFGADVRVFHDIDPRKTFHPKVYLAWNLRTAWLFVGSNNLTPGGVQDNYEAGLSLRATIAPDLPAFGDRDMIQQAVANLMDNAIKFSPPGGVIAVSARTDGALLRIEVADQGPGIPEADRTRATERFFRGEAARSTPGSGLGLALVQAVAQLHGGELQLTDAGPGLRAALALPMNSANSQSMART